MARIVLADDDATVRELARRALESDGHSVIVAADGVDALAVIEAQQSKPDLLITDIDMPQLDGIALAQQALARLPHLAIILMSGYAEQLDRLASLKATRMASISKPFTLEQFRQTVRSVL
jgi:CheY-like chemotaxis protein